MTEPTETARELLWRHQLPEDIIDGALGLHAQELAEEIREETRRLKADGVLELDKYRPCRDAANQIDPTRSEGDVDPEETASPAPATDQAALRDRIAEALYEARKNGLGGMSESAAVTYMANAVVRKLPAPADRAAVPPAVGAFATLVRQRADHLEAALNRMRDRLEVTRVRVQRLHTPGENGECQHCHRNSPCPTVQALDDPDVDELRRVAAESAPADTGHDDSETRAELEQAQAAIKRVRAFLAGRWGSVDPDRVRAALDGTEQSAAAQQPKEARP